jgi:hypothetical protein
LTKLISTCFVTAGLLAVVSCGSPTAPSAAVLNVTVSPNPITASAVPGSSQLLAAFSLTIKESAGLGASVDFVNATLADPSNGAPLNTVNFGASNIIARAGTNRIAGKGTLKIEDIGATYMPSPGARQTTMTITVQTEDDAGHTSTQSLTVPVV